MKLIYLLTGILFCCCSFSNCDETEDYTCHAFIEELVFLDPDPILATNRINALLGVLPPNPSIDDPLGHEENLSVFVEWLKQDCITDVTIDCYGCIETFPVQSHVFIYLDSSGTEVRRTLDILTPGDTVMTLRDIHL